MAMYGRIKRPASKTKRSGNYITPNALLPDDVLMEIFILAAETLGDKVAMSLVCKRFRAVMMSMRKMWDGYWMETGQTPEQIVAIAEGNGFSSLKARIKWPSFQMRRSNYEMLSHKFKLSLRVILSFGLEELEIIPTNLELCAGCLLWVLAATDLVLACGNMQNLRKLMIRNSRKSSLLPGFCKHKKSYKTLLFEKFDIPHSYSPKVDFVPAAALARSLVRCSLRRIGEADFDSLKEFLPAAKSLGDLQLFLSKFTRRFHEVCNLPSLRSLEVDFVPHPSLARRLTRCRLSLPYRGLSLWELLDFLSSLDALEALVIYEGRGSLVINEGRGLFEDPDAINSAPVVTMRSVISCEIRSYYGVRPAVIAKALIAKLRMPVLQTLKLDLRGISSQSTITRGEFRTSMQSMSSLEVLELNGGIEIYHIDEVVRFAPPHLESFSLNGCTFCVHYGARWTASPAPNRKLIHFTNCRNLCSFFVRALVNYLRTVGLGGMKIQLSACRGWRDGTFGLDDVMSATIGT